MNLFPLVLKYKLQQRLPWWIYQPCRRITNFLLGPINFGLITGHWRSALLGRPVGSAGQPVPWIAYSAIRVLQELDLWNHTVLEFGCGQSTLFWLDQGCLVTGYECDKRWAAMVSRKLLPKDRAVIRYVDPRGLRVVEPGETFDIVLVDGEDRGGCVLNVVANGLLKYRGILIVDNTDGEEQHAISHYLAQEGFSRLDYYGVAPGNLGPQCTSFYFRNLDNILFANTPKQPTARHWL